MNREIHVRFWESPEVKVLRATRHERRFRGVLRRGRSTSNSGKIVAPQQNDLEGHFQTAIGRQTIGTCGP
jgi:hypothetical protein